MRFSYLIGLLFLPLLLNAQRIDSLRQIWSNEQLPDTVRITALNNWNRSLIFINPDSAYLMISEQINFARAMQSPMWEGRALNLMGTYYLYRDLGEARNYYQQSLVLYDSIDYVLGKANVYFNLGLIFKNEGNVPLALENYQKARSFYESQNQLRGLANTYLVIGTIYLTDLTGQDSLALDYFQRSLSTFESINDTTGIATAHANIGSAYSELMAYDDALFHTNNSLYLYQNIGNKQFLLENYAQLGRIHYQKGDYGLALEALQTGLQIAEEISAKLQESSISTQIGKAFGALGEFEVAVEKCTYGLNLADTLDYREGQLNAYECLSVAYKGLGEAELALQNLSKYLESKEILDSLNNQNEITRLEVSYSYEKQQLADSIQISRLKAEQTESQLALERQKQIRNRVIGGAILIILLLLGSYLFYRYNQSRKEIAIKQDYITKLQHIDKLKDQFLANTSHELRTPLNGIIGLAESMKDGAAGPLPHNAVHNLNMIAASGKRLANLVNDILDFSKLRDQRIALQTQPIDIHSSLEIVLALSAPLANDKNLEIVNQLPDNVPIVDADENRVQQILLNLIGNAIKFTESGHVAINATPKNGFLEVTISDTGIGIPKDKFDVIFKSFEQGDGSTARTYGGTGLGLSVTKQLVELQGGEIWVRSEVGQGSQFTFTLPLSKAKAVATPSTEVMVDELEIAQLEPIADPPEIAFTPMVNEQNTDVAILVVDDEPVNRQVLQNHLSLAGYQVIQAANGKEALTHVFRPDQKFNLVLLDIMMPNMSGYEVCEAIRAEIPTTELPIVMLTAKNRVTDLVEGFKVGANDYLTKPFSRDELLSRIRTHVELQKINVATSKFVPREFLHSIGKSAITEVQLGDQAYQEVTVFFSDIRSYTSLAEKMSPSENFQFVNSYVKRMGPIIQAHEGFVNQYFGDGIMAIFPKHAEHPLAAAVEMQKSIAAYNQVRAKDNLPQIRVGMGFHTGPLIMGVIGDENRNEVATISDAVNTASRFEGLTKYFTCNILMSSTSYDELRNPEDFHLRYLGLVQVKGRQEPLGVYECFDGDAPAMYELKKQTLALFEEAMNQYFDKEFKEAEKKFEQVLDINPNDGAAQFFLQKARVYRISGVPDDWKGVETMTGK